MQTWRLNCTYITNLNDFAGHGTIRNKNSGADADTLGQALIRAGNAGVIAFNAVVSNDF